MPQPAVQPSIQPVAQPAIQVSSEVKPLVEKQSSAPDVHSEVFRPEVETDKPEVTEQVQVEGPPFNPHASPETELDSRAEGVPQPTPSDDHLDADLAITLGRPKKTTEPLGNLAEKLKGRSMLVSMGEKSESETATLEDTSGLQGEYSEKSIREAWSALIEHMRKQNKVGMAATLANGEFEFKDPSIVFTVANEVQYEELKECATELLHFVRVHAGTGKLALEVEVAEGEVATVFLTPKDRYLKWAEENPALETLRKRLDLDLG
ncbi:hypothetical protein OAO65_02815 [Flavobacteriales bacterium]|nr:hypothetical protein [Flavobacteriales bacterium]